MAKATRAGAKGSKTKAGKAKTGQAKAGRAKAKGKPKGGKAKGGKAKGGKAKASKTKGSKGDVAARDRTSPEGAERPQSEPSSASDDRELVARPSRAHSWTIEQLASAVPRFETSLREAGLADSTVRNYLTRAMSFLAFVEQERSDEDDDL